MSTYPTFDDRIKQEHEGIPVAISAFVARSGGRLTRFCTSRNDRGIDAVLECGLFTLFVDFKLLSNGLYADIPLEYEAHGKPGWAADPDKATDLFVFYWEATGAMEIYPASRLRLAAMDNQAKWLRLYSNPKTLARYGTIVAFVPPAILQAAITPEALVRGFGG